MAVYAVCGGEMWGFQEWRHWLQQAVPAAERNEGQMSVELLMQWKSFGVHRQSLAPGLLRLLSLLQQDAHQDQSRYHRFLYNERVADHRDRQTQNETLRQMGSLSHMDIAQYLSHEMRSHVVCTSNVGRGVWYVYNKRIHRWELDRDGTHVMLLCHRHLQHYVTQLRRQVNSETALDTATAVAGPDSSARGNPRSNGSTPRLPPIHRLVNMAAASEDAPGLRSEILIHLDDLTGNIRQLQAVLRALAALLYDESFPSRLDTTHEHLIPFTNGVLDLEQLRLRAGQPDDMLLRGPLYEWVDYDAMDTHVQDMEQILTTIFPDRSVRGFFLDVGASLLRRRNRYKHFYVMTGGTNGGKSLLMSLLRSAFGSLAGQMPVEALTRRGTDASTQTDYLARTAGQAFVVCNEPDGGSDLIQVDRLKQLVSDSDRLSVREMYSQQKEMVVTFKLIMPCNTPPGFSTLDTATKERTQFIPCLSTFVNEGEAASTEEQCFRDRRFVARRDLDAQTSEQLGRRLMYMLYTRYVERGMHLPSFTLRPPLRIEQEKVMQLQELTIFRKWLTAFLRPCSPLELRVISLAHHRALINAVKTLLLARERWDGEHPDLVDKRWDELDESIRLDVTTVGSPGWVRCQCVHIFHFTQVHGEVPPRANTLLNDSTQLCMVQCPFVASELVVDAFSRFRRQSRNVVGRSPMNRTNTIATEENDAAESEATTTNGGQRNSNSHYVNLSHRQRLDRSLVRGLIQEVIGQEPIEDNYLLFSQLPLGCSFHRKGDVKTTGLVSAF